MGPLTCNPAPGRVWSGPLLAARGHP